jgi:hypothetical protein
LNSSKKHVLFRQTPAVGTSIIEASTENIKNEASAKAAVLLLAICIFLSPVKFTFYKVP